MRLYCLEDYLMAGLLAILIAGGLYAVFGPHRKCLESHQGPVYHEGWTQMIHMNEMWIPLYHAPYVSTETICDKYEETPDGNVRH